MKRGAVSFCCVLVILFLIVGGMGAFMYYKETAKYKEEKEAFLERQALSEEAIEKWKSLAYANEAEAKKYWTLAEGYRIESEDWRDRALYAERKYSEAQELVERLTPNEVVAETINRLQVLPDEVYLNSLGVQFTLAAARKNLVALKQGASAVEASESWKTAYLKELSRANALESAVTFLTASVEDWKMAGVEWDKEREDWSSQLAKAERLHKMKIFGLVVPKEAVYSGGGFVLGVIVKSLFGR